jgi:hypothetical protein
LKRSQKLMSQLKNLKKWIRRQKLIQNQKPSKKSKIKSWSRCWKWRPWRTRWRLRRTWRRLKKPS